VTGSEEWLLSDIVTCGAVVAVAAGTSAGADVTATDPVGSLAVSPDTAEAVASLAAGGAAEEATATP
jgi:hypothetical protein